MTFSWSTRGGPGSTYGMLMNALPHSARQGARFGGCFGELVLASKSIADDGCVVHIGQTTESSDPV
jgi:hypothetical protein